MLGRVDDVLNVAGHRIGTMEVESALVDHPKVLKVVALSGGFSRDEACVELAKNDGVVASFSRALLEGLRHDMSDEEFNTTLGRSIDRIYDAWVAGADA